MNKLSEYLKSVNPIHKAEALGYLVALAALLSGHLVLFLAFSAYVVVILKMTYEDAWDVLRDKESRSAFLSEYRQHLKSSKPSEITHPLDFAESLKSTGL